MKLTRAMQDEDVPVAEEEVPEVTIASVSRYVPLYHYHY